MATELEWKRSVVGKVYAVRELCCSPITHFTAEDLEAGLKLAREKPVFEAPQYKDSWVVYRFKKDGDEVVWSHGPGRPFEPVAHVATCMWTDEQLEAILKARRS